MRPLLDGRFGAVASARVALAGAWTVRLAAARGSSPRNAQVSASAATPGNHPPSRGMSAKFRAANRSNSLCDSALRSNSAYAAASTARQAGIRGYCSTNSLSAVSTSPRRPCSVRRIKSCRPKSPSASGSTGSPMAAAPWTSRSPSSRRPSSSARIPRNNPRSQRNSGCRKRSPSLPQASPASSAATMSPSPMPSAFRKPWPHPATSRLPVRRPSCTSSVERARRCAAWPGRAAPRAEPRALHLAVC